MFFLSPGQTRRRRFRPRLEPLESRDCPSGGLLDTTFNGTGTETLPTSIMTRVNANVVQPDGKIVAVGGTGNYAAPYGKPITVVRLNRDGSLDTTFNNSGSVSFMIAQGATGAAVALQPDGKIVVGGFAVTNTFGVPSTEYVVARLNSDGSLDTSFANNGVFAYNPSNTAGTEHVQGVVVLSNGKIVAGGNAEPRKSGNFSLAALRLTPGGRLDSSFGSGGVALVNTGGSDSTDALAVVPTTGQVVLVGSAGSAAAVAVLTGAGKLDSSFNGTGYELYTGAQRFNGVAIHQESSTLYEIVVSGSGSSSSVVGRYFLSGAVDTAFGGAGTGFFTIGSGLTFNSLALEADGSIIVGCSQSYDSNGDTEMMVGHLSANGVLDTSFGKNGTGVSYAMIGVNSSVNSLAIDPNDGGIMACGVGSGTAALARFTAP
jgi:uncharacterized delta-60 repeat protein